MTKTSEFLPCPFCGGDARLVNVEMAGCAYVVCSNCKAQGDDASAVKAIERWNTRTETIPALLAAEREKTLREAFERISDRIEAAPKDGINAQGHPSIAVKEQQDYFVKGMRSARLAVHALIDKHCDTKSPETDPQPDLTGTSEPQDAPEVTVQQAAKVLLANTGAGTLVGDAYDIACGFLSDEESGNETTNEIIEAFLRALAGEDQT